MNIMTPPEALRPTASVTPLTLADICQSIAGDDGLGKARKSNIRSAITCCCRACNLSPADMPASLASVTERASRLHPKQVGMSAKRLANMRSEVAFAIKRYIPGPYALRGRGGLVSPWAELWSVLPAAQWRWRLSRFFKFVSLYGYDRMDLGDDLVDRFRHWLETATTAKNPESVVKETVRTWNRAAASVPGWPQQALTDIWRRETYTWPWNVLPASLRGDAEAWLETLRHPDILDEHAPRKPLSEATIEARRFQIRQIHAALVRSGIDSDSLVELADITTLERLRIVLRFHLDRGDGQASSQTAGIATAFVLIAEHWVRVEPAELAAMQVLRRKATPDQCGMTEKNQTALHQFDSERNKRLLVNLPSKIHKELGKKKTLTQDDARDCQDALALAILLCLPIRRKNLCQLDLERHFVWREDHGKARIFIDIPAAEVKNKEPAAFELNAPAKKLLDLYLDRCRPLLAKHPSSWLFPGAKPGAHTAPRNVSDGVKRLVYQSTGLRVTIHQIRHIVGKIVLDDDPSQIETVRRLLGHRSLDTTTKTYTGLSARVASHVLDDTLAGLRSGEDDDA